MEVTKDERKAAALARAHPTFKGRIEARQREEFFLKAAPFWIPGAPEVGMVEATELRLVETALPRAATAPTKFADAVELSTALDATGGTRIFYGYPSGSHAAGTAEGPAVARFSGNTVSFDSVTTGEVAKAALGELERTTPGAHVYVGSGTHGELTGDWAATDLNLRERSFFFEDRVTVAPGQLPALGPRAVLDVGAAKGARNFADAQQAAATAPPGTLICMPAWCFSTLRRPVP
jgi:hypothetical protein